MNCKKNASEQQPSNVLARVNGEKGKRNHEVMLVALKEQHRADRPLSFIPSHSRFGEDHVHRSWIHTFCPSLPPFQMELHLHSSTFVLNPRHAVNYSRVPSRSLSLELPLICCC